MIFLKKIEIDSLEDLRKAVQTAIELEHSTIPPYLTANFTLFNTGNDEISNLIGSVVGEEMLHLSISSNLLTAIGGHPILNKKGFVPTYPGPLPGGVDTGLTVPLEKFSKELIQNVFMSIEEPEDPIDIKAMALEASESMTIGQFYKKIKKKLTALETEANNLGKTIFTGDPNHQMTYEKFFPAKLLFPITDLNSALKGIDIIVDQGEGTSTDPFVNPTDSSDVEPAHYYRFQEIVKGKKLVHDPNAPNKYSYSGDPIPFNPAKIPNMWPNPKMENYPPDSLAYTNSKFFNYNYTCLLNSLHLAFNGQPEQINEAMGLMFAIRLYALKLLSNPDPNHPGFMAGPSFEFVTDEDLNAVEKAALQSQTP